MYGDFNAGQFFNYKRKEKKLQKKITKFSLLRLIAELAALLVIIALVTFLDISIYDSDMRLDQLHYCGRETASLRAIGSIISPFNVMRSMPVADGTRTIDTVYIQPNGSWQRIADLGCDKGGCGADSDKNWQQTAQGQLTPAELDLIKQPFSAGGGPIDCDQDVLFGGGEFKYYVESKLQPANRYYEISYFNAEPYFDEVPDRSLLCELMGRLFGD
jgi:hypothetical protein